jgi:hypothetical protein
LIDPEPEDVPLTPEELAERENAPTILDELFSHPVIGNGIRGDVLIGTPAEEPPPQPE